MHNNRSVMGSTIGCRFDLDPGGETKITGAVGCRYRAEVLGHDTREDEESVRLRPCCPDALGRHCNGALKHEIEGGCAARLTKLICIQMRRTSGTRALMFCSELMSTSVDRT
jgi:hypothetical protein